MQVSQLHETGESQFDASSSNLNRNFVYALVTGAWITIAGCMNPPPTTPSIPAPEPHPSREIKPNTPALATDFPPVMQPPQVTNVTAPTLLPKPAPSVEPIPLPSQEILTPWIEALMAQPLVLSEKTFSITRTVPNCPLILWVTRTSDTIQCTLQWAQTGIPEVFFTISDAEGTVIDTLQTNIYGKVDTKIDPTKLALTIGLPVGASDDT